ncbi:hypothetical protein ACPCUF_34435 [Streptomyces griseoincarnatus]
MATAIVSVAALVVSIIAYQDGHKAAASAEKREASKVVHLVTFKNGGRAFDKLIVRNTGTTPVRDVHVVFDAEEGERPPQPWRFDLVNACSEESEPLSGWINVSYLYFRDSTDQLWRRDKFGKVEKTEEDFFRENIAPKANPWRKGKTTASLESCG